MDKPQIPVKHVHYKRSNFSDQLKHQGQHHTHPTSATSKPVEKHMEKHQRLGPVIPEPCSFEKRNEEIKRPKEDWIKSQIEEEKKQATLFKAQPPSGAVKKQMQKVIMKGSSFTTSSENKENHIKFEARPPAVLYKEPFKPVLQPLHLEQKPFDLTTEKRAAARNKFDQLLKEKEKKQERLRLQREKEQQEDEERIKAVIRAKMVHNAKPVPTVAPFVPEKCIAPLTIPETPKFAKRLKKTK